MQNKSCLMRGRMREAPKKFSLSHRHTLKPIGKIIELLTTRATWVDGRSGEKAALVPLASLSYTAPGFAEEIHLTTFRQVVVCIGKNFVH